VCTPQNGYAALGVQSVHGRGQSTARGRPTGGVGGSRPLGIDDGGWGVAGGVGAGAGLPPAPWSARAFSRWPRASRERRGEVGVACGLQVGPWHSLGRLLDAGWGLERVRVRERRGV
jgi:hypothetical protein